MVFRVEQNIELFGKELEKVPFQIPFGMIDAADIGVGVEKIKNDPGEGDNRDGDLRICLSECGDEGG